MLSFDRHGLCIHGVSVVRVAVGLVGLSLLGVAATVTDVGERLRPSSR